MSGAVPPLPVFAFLAWTRKCFPLYETLKKLSHILLGQHLSKTVFFFLNMVMHCDENLIPCTLNKSFYPLFAFLKRALSKKSTLFLFSVFLHYFGLFNLHIPAYFPTPKSEAS